MRRGYLLVAAGLGAAGLILQGCASKPVVYGPIGPKMPHGYKDRPNPDGGFTVLVVMPGQSGPAALRDFFDRRAGELCPAGVERTNVFQMKRNEYTAIDYGSQYGSVGRRVATGVELEGYVYCKPEPEASKVEAGPAAAPETQASAPDEPTP